MKPRARFSTPRGGELSPQERRRFSLVLVPEAATVSRPRSMWCYLAKGEAVRGRVRGGQIELEGTLPEGTEVVVLAAGQDEPFDLDDAQLHEIEARMTAAERGEVEPAGAVLERLCQPR
jgi:hypothetical protein